jgi:DNA polymerase-3 subunit epsilon
VRYGIDNSRRTKHGALLDAEILAEVYLELIGARQASLVLVDEMAISLGSARRAAAQRPILLPPRLTAEEALAHREFIATLGDEPVWRHYAA